MTGLRPRKRVGICGVGMSAVNFGAMDWVNECLKNIQALWPEPVCVLCRGRALRETGLCRGCQASLPWLGAACPGCALPLASGELCGRCLRRPPPQAQAFALFRYEYPIAGLIQGLKFQGRLSHARLLGELMARHLAELPGPRPDLLVPVPLHRRRLRERGYNQALEIARPIGRRLGLSVDARCCRRVVATAMQSSLGRKERRANVRRAFRARLDGPRHIAVVDDVMTTGYTVAEVVRCLRSAGAERVDVWVCARADAGRIDGVPGV